MKQYINHSDNSLKQAHSLAEWLQQSGLIRVDYDKTASVARTNSTYNVSLDVLPRADGVGYREVAFANFLREVSVSISQSGVEVLRALVMQQCDAATAKSLGRVAIETAIGLIMCRAVDTAISKLAEADL